MKYLSLWVVSDITPWQPRRIYNTFMNKFNKVSLKFMINPGSNFPIVIDLMQEHKRENFKIGRKENVIFGLNGTGKTTLLQFYNNFVPQYEGIQFLQN